ncbi:TFIIB-type zinc ribbon-containing protein [Chitinilyticum litopenaei]|uniref:TFIIB-type zinc ribbon-containing protein n=1 Tax=Chitinilyticum litopenaei TaxID=1121276 RepID=UPI0004213823|nr:zf-TFIIB domain-containing protein [Chitinilyticum litopenaei]
MSGISCISCEGKLQRSEIQHGLKAQVCADCGGVWLDLDEYKEWLLQTAIVVHEGDFSSLVEVSEQSPHALFCSDCDRMLHKYRLSPQLPVRIDRCSPCGKVWLDAPEWQVLQQQGETTELLRVLNDRGQREIREMEARQRREQADLRRFGAVDYRRLQDVRSWLDSHPLRAELLAYLQKPAN